MKSGTSEPRCPVGAMNVEMIALLPSGETETVPMRSAAGSRRPGGGLGGESLQLLDGIGGDLVAITSRSMRCCPASGALPLGRLGLLGRCAAADVGVLAREAARDVECEDVVVADEEDLAFVERELRVGLVAVGLRRRQATARRARARLGAEEEAERETPSRRLSRAFRPPASTA
jgi:hypothetical protein